MHVHVFFSLEEMLLFSMFTVMDEHSKLKLEAHSLQKPFWFISRNGGPCNGLSMTVCCMLWKEGGKQRLNEP